MNPRCSPTNNQRQHEHQGRTRPDHQERQHEPPARTEHPRLALVDPAAYASPMASLTPQSPEWTDDAPVKFSAVREVAATADAVFVALAEHESWPEWFDAVDRVERVGEQHDGVGSKRRIFLARERIRVLEEFIEWEPGKVWSFTVLEANGPFRLLETLNERITIQAIGPDRTRITYLMAMKPNRGSGPLFDKVIRRGMEKNLTKALESLGRRLAALS